MKKFSISGDSKKVPKLIKPKRIIIEWNETGIRYDLKNQKTDMNELISLLLYVTNVINKELQKRIRGENE